MTVDDNDGFINDIGEVLQKQGAANHRRGNESVGGRLSVTNMHIRFMPHAVNFNRVPFVRPIGQILEIKTFGLARNGLSVHFADGAVEKFYVYHRSQWIECIESAISRR